MNIPQQPIPLDSLKRYKLGRTTMDELYNETCPHRRLEHEVREFKHESKHLQDGDWIEGDVDHNIDQVYKHAEEAKQIVDSEVLQLLTGVPGESDALSMWVLQSCPCGSPRTTTRSRHGHAGSQAGRI